MKHHRGVLAAGKGYYSPVCEHDHIVSQDGHSLLPDVPHCVGLQVVQQSMLLPGKEDCSQAQPYDLEPHEAGIHGDEGHLGQLALWVHWLHVRSLQQEYLL